MRGTKGGVDTGASVIPHSDAQTLNAAAHPFLYDRPVVYDLTSFISGYDAPLDLLPGRLSSPKALFLSRVEHVYLEPEPIIPAFDELCALESAGALPVATAAAAGGEEHAVEGNPQVDMLGPQARAIVARLLRTAATLEGILETIKARAALSDTETAGTREKGGRGKVLPALETISINTLQTSAVSGYTALFRTCEMHGNADFAAAVQAASSALCKVLYGLRPRAVCITPLIRELMLPPAHYTGDYDTIHVERSESERDKGDLRVPHTVFCVHHSGDASDVGRNTPIVLAGFSKTYGGNANPRAISDDIFGLIQTVNYVALLTAHAQGIICKRRHARAKKDRTDELPPLIEAANVVVSDDQVVDPADAPISSSAEMLDDGTMSTFWEQMETAASILGVSVVDTFRKFLRLFEGGHIVGQAQLYAIYAQFIVGQLEQLEAFLAAVNEVRKRLGTNDGVNVDMTVRSWEGIGFNDRVARGRKDAACLMGDPGEICAYCRRAVLGRVLGAAQDEEDEAESKDEEGED